MKSQHLEGQEYKGAPSQENGPSRGLQIEVTLLSSMVGSLSVHKLSGGPSIQGPVTVRPCPHYR